VLPPKTTTWAFAAAQAGFGERIRRSSRSRETVSAVCDWSLGRNCVAKYGSLQYKIVMRFPRQNRFVLVFFFLLIFCSVMVVRQFDVQKDRHVRLREAFISLQAKGYAQQAGQLYDRLLRDLEKQSERTLLDDLERTFPLVDPSNQHPESLVWKFHWSVRNELERRSERNLARDLKMVEGE